MHHHLLRQVRRYLGKLQIEPDATGFDITSLPLGNNAIHPGQLDIYDNADVATRLFNLLNVIVDNQITQSQAISELYDVAVPAPLQHP